MAWYNPKDWKDDSAGWRGKISGAVKAPFTGPKVDPYKPDQDNFQAFGDAKFAQDAFGATEERANQFGQAANDAQGRNFIDENPANQARDAMGATAGNIGTDANAVRGVGDQFQDFAAQGPGPSAAQAQLNMSTERNMREALAMAKSGRGGVGNVTSLAQADASRAQAQSDAAGQGALLRAQEEDAWRGRQLQAYGGAAEAYQGAAGVEGGAADIYGNIRQGDFNQQQAYLTQQGMNDAMSQALLDQELQRQRLGYDWAQMDQTGNMAFEAMNSGNVMAAQQGNQAADAQRDSQVLGLGAGIGGSAVALMSDINAKTNIQQTNARPSWLQQNLNSSPMQRTGAPVWAQRRTRPPPAHYGQRGAPAWFRPTNSQAPVGYAQRPSNGGAANMNGLMGSLMSDINNKTQIQPTGSLSSRPGLTGFGGGGGGATPYGQSPRQLQPTNMSGFRGNGAPAWFRPSASPSPSSQPLYNQPYNPPMRQGSYYGQNPMSFGSPPSGPMQMREERKQETLQDIKNFQSKQSMPTQGNLAFDMPSIFSDKYLKRNIRRT